MERPSPGTVGGQRDAQVDGAEPVPVHETAQERAVGEELVRGERRAEADGFGRRGGGVPAGGAGRGGFLPPRTGPVRAGRGTVGWEPRRFGGWVMSRSSSSQSQRVGGRDTMSRRHGRQ
ncbi:hypothetical protein GCM10020221_16190 [Streptomyces thioluteus]|uniref:Uncharacterized protein n=1 Tax=Streptomyces thioluteus TaxID=66431 RepID=A0ABP6J4U1_STRTU